MRWGEASPIWNVSQALVSLALSRAMICGTGVFPNIPPKAVLSHSWHWAILSLHSCRLPRTSALLGSSREASRRSAWLSGRSPEDMRATPRRYSALQLLGSIARASVACRTAAAKSSSLMLHCARLSKHASRSLFLLLSSSSSVALQARSRLRASWYASRALSNSDSFVSALPRSLASVARSILCSSPAGALPSSLGSGAAGFLPVSSSMVNLSTAPGGISSPAPSSPYARLASTVNSLASPGLMVATPRSQASRTSPPPSTKSKGSARSREESILAPLEATKLS
mmetsp:Transcript_75815/g.214357  ORF Transcript_75815/g.214357 Transcript_75815/m.214357 type:complete len:285 (-) Transcript_75815:226-1080(-)